MKELAKQININLANENITKLTRIGKKLEGEEAKKKEEKSQGKFLYRVRGPPVGKIHQENPNKRQYSTCK